jgi:hypothetical protein
VNSLIEIAVIVLKEERALISRSCDSWIWYCEAIDKKSFAFIHERYWLQATTSKWYIRQARRCHHSPPAAKILLTVRIWLGPLAATGAGMRYGAFELLKKLVDG